MWSQIVGKIRLAQTPLVNHWWNVPLYVSARGLTTTAMPYEERFFEMEFDFIDHNLVTKCSDGTTAIVPLMPKSVARFYQETMDALETLGIEVKIWKMPVEIADPIPFDQDETHRSYDAEYANRYWQVLARTHCVFEEFRARFIGKCSPVHFFWGSADLAVTRFSGRTAPTHPGGVPYLPDWVAREAYSHEVSSAGFWAGGDQYPEACFYSYAYPEPPGFAAARVGPLGAHYSDALREFVLPYEAVRRAASPEAAVLEFLQSTYEAAANLGKWQRDTLEQRRLP